MPLKTLFSVWGAPDCLRSDNGSEFVARQVKKWLLDRGIGTHYIDPGSPCKLHLREFKIIHVEHSISKHQFQFELKLYRLADLLP